MKRLLKICIMLVLVLSLFSFNSSTTEAASTKAAFVNVEKGSTLTVRSSASNKAKKMGSLKDGASVVIYSQTKSGWSEIRYNKKKAFVSTKYLGIYSKYPESKVKAAVADLNDAIDSIKDTRDFTKKEVYQILSPVYTDKMIALFMKYDMSQYAGKYSWRQFADEGDKTYEIYLKWKEDPSQKKPTYKHYTQNGKEYLVISTYIKPYYIQGKRYGDYTEKVYAVKEGKSNWNFIFARNIAEKIYNY